MLSGSQSWQEGDPKQGMGGPQDTAPWASTRTLLSL